jgi:hypothetical protein
MKQLIGTFALALAIAIATPIARAQAPATEPSPDSGKTYRLTYTVAESDQGKRIGVQHFALVVLLGKRTTVRNGSKVPVVTGSYDAGKLSAESQFTYLDVGLNFDSTLKEVDDGLQLTFKVEDSSAQTQQTISGVQEPIIRQAVIEGLSNLTVGKPVVLGSLDTPASTRHLDIEVVVEPVK